MRRRLAALIFAILGVLSAAFAWVAYQQVKSALRVTGTDRIASAAGQVADLLSQSATARVGETRRFAADPEICRAILARPLESEGRSPAAVESFVSRNPVATVWAYDVDRRLIGRLGAGANALAGAAAPAIAPVEGVSALQVADGGVWYYTTVAAQSAEHGSPVGFVSIQRSVRSSQVADLIQRLIGSGAVLKFGNDSGDVWTDLSVPTSAPPVAGPSAGSTYTTDTGEDWIGVAVPVAQSPWLVWVAVAERTMLGPADVLLRQLAPWAMGLIGLGVLGVYVVAGRLTRPLETVAQAAEAIAAGDYTRRVAVERHDEVGRLATIFNVMADAIASASHSLEARVAERTRQLEAANGTLSQREAELKRATAFLDSIVENLPAMVFVKDARERRFVLFNRAGEELLGMNRSELLGRTDRELFPAAAADGFVSRDTDVLERGVVSGVDEVLDTRQNGRRMLHTKKIPIMNAEGIPEYLLGISLDITERLHAEEAARVATLEAERANRAKSEFLSRMSHDLRTPLNATLGFAQLLDEDPQLSAEQADNVRQILRGGSHLLQLVNEVLDIARIESGGLSLSVEPVRVSDVLYEVMELMRPLADLRRISLTVLIGDGDVHVLADNQRLKQVLLNLIGNAVKYNRDDGAVQIAVSRIDCRIRISVHDTGPGIPVAKRSLLFRPFERLGAELGTIEGTGLGLALAKGLIEAMNGAIGFEEPDEGATLWVELPESESTEKHDRSEPATLSVEAPRGSGSVLYIEDNRSNVRLVERLLSRRTEIRLSTAATGAEGMASAFQNIPDLILLDLHLPDMAGEDVLQALAADARTCRIPVVVLSADATPAQRQRLAHAGARAYLTKPIVLTELLAAIDERLCELSGERTPPVSQLS